MNFFHEHNWNDYFHIYVFFFHICFLFFAVPRFILNIIFFVHKSIYTNIKNSAVTYHNGIEEIEIL
jgi:hypothetical protein